MRGQLGAVGVFKAADNFEFVGVVDIGTPQILVDEGEILLDGRREIVVILNEIAHPFAFKIFHFIEDDVDPLIQVALLFAFPAVQLAVELQHRVLILGVRATDSILDKFEDAILDQYDGDIVLCDSVVPEWAKVGVDAFKRGLDGIFALVVHADADEHLDAFEVVASLLTPLRQFPQNVHQSVDRLEVADLVLLWGVVVNYLRAVRGGNARQVLAKGCAAVCDDQSFVEARAAENVERGE
jgi:hypothetical protein